MQDKIVTGRGEKNQEGSPILECRDVTRTFSPRGRDVRVLLGVSLTVNPGEIAIVSGRSGTGKSTLLNILAGLDTPSSGAVYFQGLRTDSLSGDERATLRKQYVGVVFQSHNLISSWTARENLEGPLLHSDIAARERRRRSDSWLRALEMEDRAGHFPSELSLGQQQRLAIGRTLIHSPKLVFADEPTGDLDPDAARLLLGLLCAPVRERKMALVVMTHGIFLGNADRMFILTDGRLQEA